MTALEVARVPILSDNYVWMIHDPESAETVVIDPGASQPVLDAAAAQGWRITQIWNTHWHPDHTDGNAAVKVASGALVTGPAAEAAKIAGLDIAVSDGDLIRIGEHVARVIATPGHTAGHISIHLAEDRIAFTGDTLFAMGCGRLFEGTAADMFASLGRFTDMPDETLIYCGHEYTQSNGRYALVAEPDNAAIHSRMNDVDRLRATGEATVPTTLAVERATNPFLRARSAEQLARRRAAKDSFRG